MAADTKKTVEELEQELLETKAKLNDAKPDLPAKPKPYTKAEIKEHEAKGHIIGNPNQKLSEGHDEADLHDWELWQCELTLKGIGKIPETGQEQSVPASIQLMKLEKPAMKANDKVFQTINKQINFRADVGVGRPILFYIPKGKLETGKKYDAHYGIEETRDQSGTQKHVRLFVPDCPEITGITKKGNG